MHLRCCELIFSYWQCGVNKRFAPPTSLWARALLSIQPPAHAWWLDGNFMNKYNRYRLQWVRCDWSVSPALIWWISCERKKKKNCGASIWIESKNNVGVCTVDLKGTVFLCLFCFVWGGGVSTQMHSMWSARHERLLSIQRSKCSTCWHLIRPVKSHGANTPPICFNYIFGILHNAHCFGIVAKSTRTLK